MARPIPFARAARDPHESLETELQDGITKHAEAILAGCEVLQLLHDRGVLELMRGALGSGDKVLEIAVDAANTPQSTRSIRNLILLVKMIGEIDPELLKAFTLAIPQALQSIGEHPQPLGLWRLAMTFLRNQDSRRGLSALAKVLETLGRNLGTTNAVEGAVDGA